jgi:putative Holliday junction resolvase
MPAGGGGHSVRVAALAVLRRTLQSQQPPPAAAAAAAAATVGAGAGTGGAGQLVALDVGTSKCGLAISAPGNMLAFPLGDYRRSQAVSQDAAYLRAVFVAHRTRALVVGLPIDHRGQEGAACGAVRRYLRALLGALMMCPVCLLASCCTLAAVCTGCVRAGGGGGAACCY